VLHLARTVDETVIINVPGHDPIIITIIADGRRRGRCILGFAAPRAFSIDRGEIFLRKAEERRRAEGGAGGEQQ